MIGETDARIARALSQELKDCVKSICEVLKERSESVALIEQLYSDGYYTARTLCNVNSHCDEERKTVEELRKENEELEAENKRLQEALARFTATVADVEQPEAIKTRDMDTRC